MASGIYIILNTVNGKSYIGQAADIKLRWISHRNRLRNNRHHCKHLQHAWNKYGEAAFEFSILDEVGESSLTEREQHWMDYLRFLSIQLYNTAVAAGSNKGTKKSLETKARMSAWRRRPESNAKISASKLGKKRSPETVAKVAAANRGKKQPPELVEKRRAALKGIPKSEEHKAKTGAANRGKKRSEAHCAMMSAARLGKKKGPHSEETKAKIRAAVTDEFRAEQSTRMKATWERRRLNKLKEAA